MPLATPLWRGPSDARQALSVLGKRGMQYPNLIGETLKQRHDAGSSVLSLIQFLRVVGDHLGVGAAISGRLELEGQVNFQCA